MCSVKDAYKGNVMKYMITFIRFVLSLLRPAFLWSTGLRLALLTALPGLLCPLTVAYAHTAQDLCTRNPSGNQIQNIIVNIGRDAQINQPIGPWFQLPVFTWTCTRHSAPPTFAPVGDRYEVRTKIGPDLAGVSLGNSISVDGQNYQVYRLIHPAVVADKLGYIARIKREFVGSGGPDTDFVPMTSTNLHAPESILDAYDGGPRSHGEQFQFRITLQVRLVKLHANMAGVIYNSFLYMPMYFYTLTRVDHGTHWKAQKLFRNSLNVTIKSLNAACTTPKINVPLGDAHGGNLRNINDTGPTTAFNLRFENCPAYMSSVAYRFHSIPQQAIANGILPLDPILSTASGVGVQVLNADDTPLAFNNTFIPLAAYDAFNPDPLYLVPMKARIIRTSGTLQGGDVHAVMKMVVRYR